MSSCAPCYFELLLILVVGPFPCRSVQSPTTEQRFALQDDGSLLHARENHDGAALLQPPSLQPNAGPLGGASVALAGTDVRRESMQPFWRQKLARLSGRLGRRHVGVVQIPGRLRQGLEIIYEPVVVREDMLTIRFETKDFNVAATTLDRAELADDIMQFFITAGLPRRVARRLRIRFRQRYQNKVDVYSAKRPYPEVNMRELRKVLIRRPIVVDGVAGAIMPTCFCREGCLSGTCYVTNSACATAHNDSMSSLLPAPLAPPLSLEPTGSPTTKPDSPVPSPPVSSNKELKSSASSSSLPLPLPPVNSTKDEPKARASFTDVIPAALQDTANTTEVAQQAIVRRGSEKLTNEDQLLENVGDEDEDKALDEEDNDKDANAASEKGLEPRVAELESLVGTYGEDLKTLEKRLANVEDDHRVVEAEAKIKGGNGTTTGEERKKENAQPLPSQQAWTYCDSIGGIWREDLESHSANAGSLRATFIERVIDQPPHPHQ